MCAEAAAEAALDLHRKAKRQFSPRWRLEADPRRRLPAEPMQAALSVTEAGSRAVGVGESEAVGGLSGASEAPGHPATGDGI